MKDWPNAALVVIFLAVLLVISGCQRVPQQVEVVDSRQSEDTSGPRGGTLHDLGDGVWVWTDPDTGCEYLVLYTHGITPRMEDKGGNTGYPNPQMGCKHDNDRE